MSNLATINNVTYTYDHKFVSFFEEFIKGQRSKNTGDAYRTDIKQFCDYTFQKDVSFVTIKDIESLTSLEAMKYHNHLKTTKTKSGSTMKNASIKRKIDAVTSLLNALKVDHQKVNNNIFDNLKLEKVELDRTGYGNLTWDEAYLFVEYAYIEEMEGNQMSMLLKLACISSIRLEALLSLTWEDFRIKNEKGVFVNYIDIIDKGSRHQTPVSEKLFKELRAMLGTKGKLFPNLYKHKVGKFIKEINDYFEIDPKRNIKFHSFKKCGVNRVLEKTGDLTKAQLQGKHKSIVTTQTNYIELTDDLTQKPSYTLDQDLDIINEIKDLSHEELMRAIVQLSNSAQYELMRVIKKG